MEFTFSLFLCEFSSLQKQQIDMVEKNKKLQKKLEEILPECIKDEGNFNVYDYKNTFLQQ